MYCEVFSQKTYTCSKATSRWGHANRTAHARRACHLKGCISSERSTGRVWSLPLCGIESDTAHPMQNHPFVSMRFVPCRLRAGNVRTQTSPLLYTIFLYLSTVFSMVFQVCAVAWPSTKNPPGGQAECRRQRRSQSSPVIPPPLIAPSANHSAPRSRPEACLGDGSRPPP